VLFVIDVPWDKALAGIFIPHVTWTAAFFTTLVAIFGTTISPYLFFWQASEEAEEQRIAADKRPLRHTPTDAPREFRRIRADTITGMAFSNLIAIAIIAATAATLHDKGITNIETSAQAAEALRPIAGPMAEWIFALGIVGTGLLAIPVLAGATAYAVGESRGWPVGLARKPRRAKAFNAVLALSVIIGVAMNFTPINPIAALYWSAVINGVIAVPIMVVMMVLSAKRDMMGDFVITGPLRFLGWLSTAAMAACVVAMAVTMAI
jgi:Mn2+/Fe2+ NRAMP family transporter